MLKTETHLTAVTALPAGASRAVAAYADAAVTQACSAPMAAAHGTTVSAAGLAGARIRSLAAAGATALAFMADVPGSPPREAPV